MKMTVENVTLGSFSSAAREAMLLLMVAVIAAGMICGFPIESRAAGSKELSMASLFPPDSPSAKSLDQWAEKVKVDSKGLLSIRHYAANTLISAPDMRTGVRTGVADIGCSFIYKPEPNFDPSMMMSALILGLSYEHCLKIFDDVWNKFPELWAGQWKDYKLLWITPIDPNLLVTAKQPVRKMEDIKGLQIRIPNAISADVIKQMLAVPVSMSSGDWIVSLDKGTTDGAAMSNGSLLDYKIGEKVRYVTYYSLGPGILFLTMNKDTWKDLSPEMQQVINNSAGWGRQHMIDCKRQSEKEAIDYLKSKGVEFIKLSADQFARWDATIKPVFDKMANDLNAKGFPGTALVTYALERAKYYSTQE